MAPFKSKKQARWMFANKPKLAEDWADKYGGPSEKEKEKRQTDAQAKRMLKGYD